MKRALFLTICLAAASTLVSAQLPAAAPPAKPLSKATVVSRLYQLTQGARPQCARASTPTAQAFQAELTRYEERHPRLVELFGQALAERPDLQRQLSNLARDRPSLQDAECDYLASLLRMLNDTPEGQRTVQQFEAVLSAP